MRASNFIRLKARFLLLALALLSFALSPAVAQMVAAEPDRMDRGSAQLLTEGAAEAGKSVDLAIMFQPQEGWHGYWSNPGDAGLGMELEWTLPEGWQVGDLRYPVPQILLISGLMNHVYEGEHAVIAALSIPDNAATGRAYPISVHAEWLTCSDRLCVPQWGTLHANVTLGENGAVDARFDTWRAAVPPLLDSPASFELTDSALRIAIPVPASLELADPHVFISQTQLVDYVAAQIFTRMGDALIAEIPRKGLAEGTVAVSGILKLDGAGNGVTFAAVVGDVPTGGTRLAGGSSAAQLAPLWVLLGGALLGGLLLNIMPCVFPILSLKAMSLARAGESEAKARREGTAYTGGVVLAVLALGALLLALRGAGNEIGWAFQLQEPGVVAALLVLGIAITANLAGLYELPSLSFTRKGGRSSAFATGLLAAFVATPCTGPFMAAAMGAALLLPWWQALLLFAALGLGLALPFLLLGFVPPLRKMLPKPGAWMETFRRVMAVPMGLTALALLWLVWRLGGDGFAIIAAIAMFGLLIALWAAGRRQRAGKPAFASFALIAAPFAIFAAIALPMAELAPPSAEGSVLAAQPFSEAVLAEARASGKPVFLWFTADWCVTCKVNESVAIEREATRDAFAQAGVIAIRGDWTRRDPEITRFLTARGAAGVPLYLWYPVDGDGEQLGQLLGLSSLIELAEGR